MLCRREATGWLTLAMTLALPVTLVAAPEFQGRQPVVAQMETAPTRIDWLPQVEYQRLVLTVSGPGDTYIRRVFRVGQVRRPNTLP
jgi:hypothetical protein